MTLSVVCPARHINSISFVSVCCRSLSTSTYDESVLTAEITGRTDGREDESVEAEFRATTFGDGPVIFCLRLAILG